jgi:hypothetical protein
MLFSKIKKIKMRYKILFVLTFSFLAIKVCLSFDKKKEDAILTKPTKIVSLTIKPDTIGAKPINTGVFGINLGFGFARELDKDSGFVQLLREAHPSSLRFPGGTVANFYHPNLPGYGYKSNEMMPSLMGLYNLQKTRKENILYNFIRLCKLVNTKAVFCANMLTGSTEETMFVIDELKKNNIPIAGVELGNEYCLMPYRKQFPDANTYIKKIKATAIAIREKYPDLKLIVIAGDAVPLKDMNSRSKFMRAWNQVLNKENFYDAYTWHTYPSCDACDKDIYFDNVYSKNLKSLTHKITQNLYNVGADYAQQFGTNRKLWVTEWNIGNFGFLDNTFTQAAYASEFLLSMIDLNTKYGNYFEVSNLHSIEGLINDRKSKQQPVLTNGNNVATTQYFAYKFLSSTLTNDVFRTSEKIICNDTSVSKNFICNSFVNKKENKTYLHFVNRSGKKIQLTVNTSTKTSMQITSIEAEYPYATTGKPAYENNYPNKLQPVIYKNNEVIVGNSITIAPYAFGYISY